MYLTARDLREGPDRTPTVPSHHEDAFTDAGRFNVDPVTWHDLARHGVAVRGLDAATLPIHLDDAALRALCRRNLDTSWDPWSRPARQFDDLVPAASLKAWAVEWAVLGAARVHATITTGEILSKTAAGAYAREQFDERYHPIIDEALRIRAAGSDGQPGTAADPRPAGSQPSGYRTPFGRRRARREFVAMVMTDAEE